MSPARAMRLALLAIAAVQAAAAAPDAVPGLSPADAEKLHELKKDLLAGNDPSVEGVRDLMASLHKLPKPAPAKPPPGLKATPQELDPVKQFEEAARRIKEAREFANELKQHMDNKTEAHVEEMKKLKPPSVLDVAGAVATGVVAHNVKTQLQVRQASCAFNSVLASQYVTRAALHITALTKTCHPVGPDQSYITKACRANAAGIFASVGLIAAYISLAASQCGALSNIKALCAGSIELIIAGLGKVASAANIMDGTCNPAGPAVGREGETSPMWQFDRRLQANFELPQPADGPSPAPAGQDVVDVPKQDHAYPPFETYPIDSPDTKADHDFQLTTCILDITQIATALGQFSLAFKESVVNCGAHNIAKGIPVLGPIVQDTCTTQVGLVIYGIATAAQFIAASIAQCGTVLRLHAACVAAAEQVVSVAGALVFVGGGIDATCVRLPKFGPLANVIVPLTAVGRRLDEAKSYHNMTREERLQVGKRLLGMEDDATAAGRDSVYV